MLTVCITEGYFAYGEDTHTLRLTSKLVDLRVGCAKWIRRTEFAEPHLKKLRKYDARCCIIFTEGYRSGHNEAVLKTVCLHGRVSSNLTPSAKIVCSLLRADGFLLFSLSLRRNLLSGQNDIYNINDLNTKSPHTYLQNR